MIKHIYISNFRSIVELEVEPRNLSALIGPNSTGKTNVLKAIDLVLGEGWTTKAKVARELFNDVAKPIVIEITITQPFVFTNYKGVVCRVFKVKLEMKMQPDFSCAVRMIDENGYEHYLNEDFKKFCHFIYIPSFRDLNAQMRVSNWTLLGKLMKVVYDNYVTFYGENEDALKDDFKKIMFEPKAFLENDFDPSPTTVTFKKFSDCFKKYCIENSAGFASTLEPNLNIYNLNWFYKTLQISVKEKLSPKEFDSEEVGAGMQNLILISIFQTYAELMGGKVIFGIEEPEIFLYPQAQRSLYKCFQSLSEKTQIIYTTHNPNFVDAQRAYEIVMLQRHFENGTYKFEKSAFINEIEAEKQKFKIYSHFNTERNEIFFAKKILLVEGASDKILFTTLLNDKWGIDIDKLGISVIECGGKGGVIYFSGLCIAMGMDNFYAVWDEDEEVEDKHSILATLLKKGQGLELAPNLEVFLNSKIKELNLNPNSNDKIKQAFDWITAVDPKIIPEEFEQLKPFFEPIKVEETEANAQV